MSILIRFDALLKTLHILFNDVVFIFYGVLPFLHFFSVFLQLEIYVSRDCEQCLLFFRFSKWECTRAPAPASSGEAAREERESRVAARKKKKFRASHVARLLSRACSFTCLARFALGVAMNCQIDYLDHTYRTVLWFELVGL